MVAVLRRRTISSEGVDAAPAWAEREEHQLIVLVARTRGISPVG